MKIFLNNKEQKISSKTISELIKELELQNNFIAVTKNGTLIKKANWQTENVQERDKIDIFSPAGGG